MAETSGNVPGTDEAGPEKETGSGGNTGPGIRRVGLRAEIDTSPPFGSVKEAVTRFGGSGPWVPGFKLGEPYNSIEDFDIKKVEEQAAELEKDLIVKELETLDVLEELGATKRIVEELKQRLQKQVLKCFPTSDVNSYEYVGAPVVKEMNQENSGSIVNNQEQILPSQRPCSISSPELLFMELKQAKMNLGKTINDLGAIQSSVESLNKKMKKERVFLEKTREKLASKFAAVSAQERAHEEARSNPPAAPAETNCTFDNPLNIRGNAKSDAGLYNRMVEVTKSEVSKPLPECEDGGFCIKTAEMRWFAAKKMEEAARAAEAVAFAEIKALSSAGKSSEYAQSEPRRVTFALGECSPLNPKAQIPEESTLKNVIDAKLRIDEINTSKLTMLKKLEEATEEVLQSKQLLTEALNSVETANRKQHAAKEALWRWIPEDDPKVQSVYNSGKCNRFNQPGNCQDSHLPGVIRSATANNNPKPILRSTVSMRDVLSIKQVPEDYTSRQEMEEHTERKVALSQMLRALREDLTLPMKPERNGRDQKQFIAQRKKFGFIQISLPLGKPSKKRA